MKSSATFLLLLILVLMGTFPLPAFSCSESLSASFVSRKMPDLPLAEFAKGRLGAPQPGWARSYLVVVYRHLSGLGLDEEAQRAAVTLWRNRLGLEWAESPEAAMNGWLQARLRVMDEAPEPIRPWGRSDWSAYANCTADAFRTAAATMERRVSEDPLCERATEWVQAQDVVFSNCSGTTVWIPPALAAGSSAVDRADRDWQIAAATFYAGDHDGARDLFLAIDRDRSSPWRELAPYLAARCLIRKGFLSEGRPDPEPLARAYEELSGLEKGAAPGLAAAMRRHLALLARNLSPKERIGPAADALLVEGPGSRFGENLDFYTRLLDDVFGEYPAAVPEETDELTRWIMAFGQEQPNRLPENVARWRERKSLPWLAIVSRQASWGDPEAAEILDALSGVPPGSPGEAYFMFHRIRLLAEAGENEAARGLLDAWPDDPAFAGWTSSNQMRSLRGALARTLDEFLAAAPRFAGDETGPRAIPALEADTVDVLNRWLPLDRLQEVQGRLWSNFTHQDVRRAVRIRTLLLREGERGSPDELAERFRALRSDYSAPWIPLVEQYDSAYRWCRTDDESTSDWTADPPSFLPEADLLQATREYEALRQIGSAPSFFCREALAFARRFPRHLAAPELLHLAVTAGRTGGRDDDTARLSSEAFRLLHTRWRESDWAKRTPYWYEGR
jgi:hypothetical protein